MISVLKRLIPVPIKARVRKLLNRESNISPIPFYQFKPIRILFVAQHPSIWASWRSLWQECSERGDVVVKVVIAPFIHPLSSKGTTKLLKKLLKNEGVSFSTSSIWVLKLFQPHVVLLQNPYDSTRPEPFKAASLIKQGHRVGYIPYGLEMGGGQQNIDWQFNLDFHHSAWRIFARSERHKSMFAKYSKVGARNVVVTGHPKFDNQLQDLASTNISEQLKEKIAGRKVVLWTPHFSVGLPATWSTYRIYGQAIIDQSKIRKDMFFIIRPHPLFFKSMKENGLWTDEGETLFREQCKNHVNLWLDEEPDYNQAFALADALMTDVGSFLLEFLPTGKPILYLHHPEGIGLNDDGELTDYLYKANSVAEVISYLDMVINNQDPGKNVRNQIVNEYLFGLEGNAGKRILTHIVDAIKAGDEQNLLESQAADLQDRSTNYWSTASNSFLAPPEYYMTKKSILESVIAKLPNLKSAVDIGCGNGFFTNLLANKVANIIAYDVSAPLIDQAVKLSRESGLNNISYEVRELDSIPTDKKAQLVSCMGVTSCMLDDEKFVNLLKTLQVCSEDAAYLLMIDSLALQDERVAAGDNGYIAKYRNIGGYISTIESMGFVKELELVITEDLSRNLTNKLFLFRYQCN